MTATDINQQLFDERRQLAQSEGAVRRDDGSWVYAAEQAEVFGRDGLAQTEDGTTALYTTTPAWHGLGQVIPGGTTDVDRVLALGGINWDVTLRKVRYHDGHHLRTMADQFVAVRSDTGTALGVVGKFYRTIQNRQAFEFLQDLVADTGVLWESAGALRGGAKTFISIRLPQTIKVDAEGISDEIVPFVALLNAHDGKHAFQCVVTPWRPVCANTERFAVRDAHARWAVRHTGSALSRLQEARRTLKMSSTYFDRFAAEENLLARTELTLRQYDELIESLWPAPGPGALNRVAVLNHERRRAELDALYRSKYSKQLGTTAYAAERSLTEYLDWLAPTRASSSMTEEVWRGQQALDGAADQRKTRIHHLLMQLTSR